MQKIELYVDKKTHNYYYTGFAICGHCKRIISRIAIIVKDTKKGDSYYCPACVQDIPASLGHEVRAVAIITDRLPGTAIPVLQLGPEFVPVMHGEGGVIGVWEAGVTTINKNGPAEQLDDKTIRHRGFMIQGDAKKPIEIEDSRIQAPKKISKEEAAKIKRLESAIINGERLVSERELDDILENVLKAEPAFPMIERPTLEDKREVLLNETN